MDAYCDIVEYFLKQGTLWKECNHCLILSVISLALKFSEEAEPMGNLCQAGSSYGGVTALSF